MNTKILAVLVLVLAIGVLGGCENPADDVPSATVTDAQPVADPGATEPAEPATETAAEPAPMPEPEPAAKPMELTFTDNSVIAFTGSKVTGTHSGGFVDFAGTVSMPEGTFESAQITIEIAMASLFSDNGVLTETLIGERFFEVEKYPTSKFVSTGIEKTADGYTISGNLEMHGVTKGISFPATVTMEDGVLTSTSEFSIDRFQWEIEDVGMQDDLIRKEVVIKFEIEAA